MRPEEEQAEEEPEPEQEEQEDDDDKEEEEEEKDDDDDEDEEKGSDSSNSIEVKAEINVTVNNIIVEQKIETEEKVQVIGMIYTQTSFILEGQKISLSRFKFGTISFDVPPSKL